MASCVDCRFFDRERSYTHSMDDEGESRANCLRYPPYPPAPTEYAAGHVLAGMADWPVVWSSQWCGEHQPSPPVK